MSIATVFQNRYKLASVLAVVCLALMLVLLGAVAKNSQFQSPSNSNQYLKQSVKMVSGQDYAGVLKPPGAGIPVSLAIDFVQKFSRPAPSQPPQPLFAPLLI